MSTKEAEEQCTCDLCGETFTKGWSDEEARAEAAESFPTLAPRDTAVVCDPCYRMMMEGRDAVRR